MSKVLRIVISGNSVAELIRNTQEFLAEVSGQEQITSFDPRPITSPHISEQVDKSLITGVADRINAQAPGSPPIVTYPGMPQAVGNAPAPAVGPDLTTTASPNAMTASSGMAIGDVDSRGFPWDERIHAISRNKNKNGSWRYCRGVEQSTIDHVEHEMRSRGAALRPSGNVAGPVAPPIPQVSTGLAIDTQHPTMVVPPVAPAAVNPFGTQPPPPVIAGPVSAPLPPVSHVPDVPVAAPLHVVPATPPPSIPVPQAAPMLTAHTLETFKANLVATLAKLVSEGKLTQEYIASLNSYFGIDQIYKVNEAQLAEMFENFIAHRLIVRAE